MDEKLNYQKLMEKRIADLDNSSAVPSLLLHVCCAPCSSSVLEQLVEHFKVTLYFYNPNIYPSAEYDKRYNQLFKLAEQAKISDKISIINGEYDSDSFIAACKGLEGEPEGGLRCSECFKLRLENTAKLAVQNNFSLFATTLTVSPHKNAELINQIGTELSEKYGVEYLCSDFKKKDGYKRSVELCKLYGIYRQEYCGCRFSLGSEL